MISAQNEDKLRESLIWSDTHYSLAEFVEKYKLPQVVQVEEGFFDGNERTSLGSGQVLTLHSVHATKKFVCETVFNNAVVIPSSCPLRVVVQPHPQDCQYTKVSTDQLASIFSEIKYVYVLEGHYNAKYPKESFQTGEVLEIREIDSKNCFVKCKNVTTKRKMSVPFGSKALFAPLVDCKNYTLAEVKQIFGLPAKVRFLEEETKRCSSSSNETSPMLVSSLGEITVLEEIEQTLVISTTGDGNAEGKLCLQIPKDLPVQITVAEGFIRGDGAYQNIVQSLDQLLNRSRLQDCQNLNVYQHKNSMKKHMQEMSWNITFEQPSDAVQQKLLELRSKELKDEPTPKLPPKKPLNLAGSAPRIPPKPGPKPELKPEPMRDSKQVWKTSHGLTTKLFNGLKSSTLSKTGARRKSTLKSSSSGVGLDQKPASDFSERICKSDSDYDYAFVGSCDSANYENIYEELQWKADDKTKKDSCVKNPKAHSECNQPQSLPQSFQRTQVVQPSENQLSAVALESSSSPLPVTESKEVCGKMTKFPNDLSGLSVEDVSELLRSLHMDCYVGMFVEEMVDGEMLLNMDQESLESLNMKAFHVKKLMKFIEGWRPCF